MATKGLELETAFFEALKRHFFLIQDKALDRHGIDAIIVSAKTETVIPVENALYVQVTTRLSDSEKIFLFHKRLREFRIKKTAYIEIDEERITPSFVHMATAAINALLFDKLSPANALIRINASGYQQKDADEIVRKYQAWLAGLGGQKLFGVIVFWHWQAQAREERPSDGDDDYEQEVTGSILNEQGYGFIEVLGKDRSKRQSVLRYFAPSREIDEPLRKALTDISGRDKMSSLVVSFEDGGCRVGYSKRTARFVKLCPGEIITTPSRRPKGKPETTDAE